MKKLRLRKGFWIIIPAFMLGFFASPVKASTYETFGASDFFFEFQETSQFTVRTYAWQNGIDSMLWIYDSENQLLAANDDYFGLDSFVILTLQPGVYRLRTGVCCGDPDRWYGSSYTFETNVDATIPSEPTVPETTTTIPEQTTTVPEPTTTIPEAETTVPEITTTTEVVVIPETTTSVQETTTTSTSTTILPSPPPLVITTAPQTTTTIIEPSAPSSESEDNNISDIFKNINELEETAIINAISEIIKNGLNENDALLISTNSKILESITQDQAKKIFNSIDISNISIQEEKALAEALSNAPVSIKNAFENEVDIFGEGFDEYVPTGSSIDVGTRRAIIAITAIATTITITAPSSGGASSSPSGSSGTSTDRSSNRSRRN